MTKPIPCNAPARTKLILLSACVVACSASLAYAVEQWSGWASVKRISLQEGVVGFDLAPGGACAPGYEYVYATSAPLERAKLELSWDADKQIRVYADNPGSGNCQVTVTQVEFD